MDLRKTVSEAPAPDRWRPLAFPTSRIRQRLVGRSANVRRWSYARSPAQGFGGCGMPAHLLADLAVMLSHIVHVIEARLITAGSLTSIFNSQPMRLLLVVGSADFGRSIDFGGSADLRAQHQGERNGGHSSEDGE